MLTSSGQLKTLLKINQQNYSYINVHLTWPVENFGISCKDCAF